MRTALALLAAILGTALGQDPTCDASGTIDFRGTSPVNVKAKCPGSILRFDAVRDPDVGDDDGDFE